MMLIYIYTICGIVNLLVVRALLKTSIPYEKGMSVSECVLLGIYCVVPLFNILLTILIIAAGVTTLYINYVKNAK